MGNPGTSPTANLPYLGGRVNFGYPGVSCSHHTDQPKPKLSATVLPNHGLRSQHTPHRHGCSSRSYSQHIFPRTPAFVTPNPWVEGEVNDGVRDQIARTLIEFGFTPKGRARSYQKPYPEYFDAIPYPRGFRVPDLAKFMGDDAKTTYEHIGQFLAQVNDVGITDVHKIRMFPLSLTGAAFN
jgi:hypothetical protein